MGFNGTLEFLTAVREKFGSEKEKYCQFFQIALDFFGEKVIVDGKRTWKVQVSGDKIIGRSKELFGGDEELIIGFYNLLLDSRRKHERPDGFWAAFDYVRKITMSKPMEADCSEQQGRADIEIRTEDTYTINRKKEIYRKLDDTHQAVESDDYVASSSDSKSIPRTSSVEEGHKDKYAKAGCRDEYEEKHCNDTEKSLHLKQKRHKTNGCDNFASKEQHFPLKKGTGIPCGQQSSVSSEDDTDTDTDGGLVSEVGLNELLDHPSCTPSYRLLPEKITKRLESQWKGPEAKVLNNSWVSVCRGVCLHLKKNEYEEVLFLLENDMYELDMLLESINATAKKVVEIEGSMSDPSFTFDIEKAFTASNLRCLMQFYYPGWADKLKAVRKNAAAELSNISKDLKKWTDYLRYARVEFHKLCREVYEEHVPKLYNRGNNS